jgi:hypothetical protein
MRLKTLVVCGLLVAVTQGVVVAGSLAEMASSCTVLCVSLPSEDVATQVSPPNG